jgi:hypothetical protein
MKPSRVGIAAVMTALAAGLSGCAATVQQAAQSRPITTSSRPAASPSPAAGPVLTITQARVAYQRIIDPYNRTLDAVNTDAADAAPISQLRADTATAIAGLQVVGSGLNAIRWPASVQPHISAMLLTDVPDNIACYAAERRAPTYEDVQVADAANQSCIAAYSSTNADQVRILLGLPPRS